MSTRSLDDHSDSPAITPESKHIDVSCGSSHGGTERKLKAAAAGRNATRHTRGAGSKGSASVDLSSFSSTRRSGLSTPRSIELSARSNNSDRRSTVMVSNRVDLDFEERKTVFKALTSGLKKKAVKGTDDRKRAMQLQSLPNQASGEGISQALVEYIASDNSKRDHPQTRWIREVLIMVSSLTLAVFLMCTIPWGGLLEEYTANVFTLWTLPFASFFYLAGNVQFYMDVLERKLRPVNLVMTVSLGCVLMTALLPVLSAGGSFPVPLFMLASSALGLAVTVPFALFMSKPDAQENRPVPNFQWFPLLVVWNWVLMFVFIFYAGAFFATDGYIRNIIAATFLGLKYAIKRVSKYIFKQLDNPDFTHAQLLYVDILGACLLTVMYVLTGKVLDFFLLVLIDVLFNVNIVLSIVSEATYVQKQLVMDVVRTLSNFKDDITTAEAMEEVTAVCFTPRLVEMCSKLFFCAITDSFIPMALVIASGVVFALPVCNGQFLTYIGDTSNLDGFGSAIGAAIASSLFHLIVFILLRMYVFQTTELDVWHVGFVLMSRSKLSFALLLLGLCLFFVLNFVEHAGTDYTFQFVYPPAEKC